jgi:hypothetical protein
MRILVAGDIVTDHYVYEGQQHLAGSTVREGARWISDLGGAALVGRLLQEVAADGPVGAQAAVTPRFLVDLGFANATQGPSVRNGFCLMQPCDRQRGQSKQVWRMTYALGFSSDMLAVNPQAIQSVALDRHADVVVLDDAALGFRRWPNRQAWPKFLREPVQNLPEWVVLKMSGPIASGDLWHTIVSGHTQPDGQSGSPPPEYLGQIAERTILALSIDELRRESVRVDGRLSWERAAADLIEDLETNPRLQSLTKLGFIIIRFGLDGALVVDRSSAKGPRHSLIFDPAGIEGSFLAGVAKGSLFGYQSCLTAAIVCKLVDAPATATPAERVMSGVEAGLNAMRHLALDGHEPDQVSRPPTSFPYARVSEEIVKSTHQWAFGSVELPAGLTRTTPLTIIAGIASHPPAPLWGLARRVAIHGVGQLAGIPYLQFAKLFSVDRSEIESFRTLQRLLTNYKQDERTSKPLSIAAFGPPGSGKSFGVKQLAEALFGDKNPLEFNLSQFSTARELHDLFHQIRDRVLLGNLPIVFWDEFDSRNLEWLQYLLAPMQDGTFQDGQITHPIGKCVFVFAGGTRDRFEEFGKPPAQLVAAGDKPEIQKWSDDFKMKKGPDFMSRLAGYINVLGPNPAGTQDITYPVRRALLLRVHLGIKPTTPTAIDSGLLEAFLRVGRYRHGARSLEKIVEQVRLSARAGAFNRSDLPPRQQIDLHVDADEFLNLVESA